MIKIAHISDLHLWKITYNFSQFFSKRWLGNFNLIFFRKKKFSSNQISTLPSLFKKLKINYVIVTGDISSTSLHEEFKLGLNLFNKLKEMGIKPLFLPGNHDSYTKKAHREKSFYKYFNNIPGKDNIEQKYSLKEDGVEAHILDNSLWYVGIDCTLATHLMSSRGLFSAEIEKNLKSLLSSIPKKDNIIVANHFPFRMTTSPRKALKKAGHLKKILKRYSNIKLFLHGHTHHHNILDLREKHLPIVLDSGSTAHNQVGKWNLLEINNNSCNIQVFDWIKNQNKWKETENKHYQL